LQANNKFGGGGRTVLTAEVIEKLRRLEQSRPDEVWNCPDPVEFRCPKRWEELAATADAGVRHCPACREDVYWSPTPGDFVRNGQLGRCVAVPAGVTLGVMGRSFRGRPSAEAVRELAVRQAATEGYWRAVFALAPPFEWAGMADARLAAPQTPPQELFPKIAPSID
jgi:hypothetical protein